MTAVAREVDAHLPLGMRVADRWILGEPIGSGGHATVYRAEHDTLGHAVAIKVLHMDRCGQAIEEMLGRFRREARIAAQLQHPNVVQVFDFGELDDGSPFFVMELVEGEDLQARLDREGPLPIGAAVDVAMQTLAGLAALESAGVVHRDVKPGNVMLQPCRDGGYVAKLVDFGIAGIRDCPPAAKYTIEGTVLGTPEYMSPEQIRGIELDSRADVWGLGVVLYEALTGALPFEGKGPCATLAMALTQEPESVYSRRTEVPLELDAIVMRALAKDRNARWDSPLVMSVALGAVASDLGLPVGADAWEEADALSLVRTRKRVGDRAGKAIAAHAISELDIPGVVDARESGTHVSPRRRPAARARVAKPEAVPERVRSAREELPGNDAPPSGALPLSREGDALLDELEAEIGDIDEHDARETLTLEAKARSVSPALARVVVALIGLGIATALSLGLTEPEQLRAIGREDLEGVHSVSVPPPRALPE